MSALRRGASAALRACGSIRSALVWRLVYAALAHDATVAMAVRVLGRSGRARTVVGRLHDFAVVGGWPGRHPGWVNVDVSRFAWRVSRRLDRARSEPKHLPRSEGLPLRIACVGAFRGLLAFGKPIFEGVPDTVEIGLVDLEFEGAGAEYLRPLVAFYEPVAAIGDDAQQAAALADAVDRADADLALVVVGGRLAYEVVDRLRTPVISYCCTGSDVLHHPKVDFQIYVQPEPDYFVREDRLFCGTSRASFGGGVAFAGFINYDERGLLAEPRLPWHERDSLLVYHGSLYKAASPAYLHAVFDLMEDDTDLEFVLMGRDTHDSLDAIRRHARVRGLTSRVHYEGRYSGVRSKDGLLDDPGWARLVGHLARARLAPDPWPMCGASSRVEAYAMGVPSVHLGTRFDRGSWGRPQPTVCELPALLVPEGTAYSPAEYVELCRRATSDREFAERVIAAQIDVVRHVSDPAVYWTQVLDLYSRWRTRRAS